MRWSQTHLSPRPLCSDGQEGRREEGLPQQQAPRQEVQECFRRGHTDICEGHSSRSVKKRGITFLLQALLGRSSERVRRRRRCRAAVFPCPPQTGLSSGSCCKGTSGTTCGPFLRRRPSTSDWSALVVQPADWLPKSAPVPALGHRVTEFLLPSLNRATPL